MRADHDHSAGGGRGPEQVSGRLRREGALTISHETIYRDLWADKHAGGTLYRHLRGARKRRRKRYGGHDSRGRLPSRRDEAQPPAAQAARRPDGSPLRVIVWAAGRGEQ